MKTSVRVLFFGLIALMLYLIPPLLTCYSGYTRATLIQRSDDIWHQGMYYAGLVFIIVVMTVTAHITAFMQRFPINMYFFLILGIMLHSMYKVDKGTQENNAKI